MEKQQHKFGIDLSEMGLWEAQKAVYIAEQVKDRLGVELWQGTTQAGVNQNSGNVWLWNEDWQVSFFMPIYCELKPEDVSVCWSNPEDGDEHEAALTEFHSMDDVDAWVDSLDLNGDDE